MELSLKRHPLFRDYAVLIGVATHFRRLRHPRVRRKIPCVSFFQSTKWHFTHGFGKLVCTTGKTCDDDVLRSAASLEKFPIGFLLGELI